MTDQGNQPEQTDLVAAHEQRIADLEERVRALEEQSQPREPDEDIGLP